MKKIDKNLSPQEKAKLLLGEIHNGQSVTLADLKRAFTEKQLRGYYHIKSIRDLFRQTHKEHVCILQPYTALLAKADRMHNLLNRHGSIPSYEKQQQQLHYYAAAIATLSEILNEHPYVANVLDRKPPWGEGREDAPRLIYSKSGYACMDGNSMVHSRDDVVQKFLESIVDGSEDFSDPISEEDSWEQMKVGLEYCKRMRRKRSRKPGFSLSEGWDFN